jgi:hypothetical protein
MRYKLIDGLTTIERVTLFMSLGGLGLFWTMVVWVVDVLLGWGLPTTAFIVCWGVVVFVAVWALEHLHNLNGGKRDE